MKIESQIEEAQARIEVLRLELALAESHRSNLQLAKSLLAEITDSISDKLAHLAELVPADCLVQAVDTITFEVEKAATLLLAPAEAEYDDESKPDKDTCDSDKDKLTLHAADEYSYEELEEEVEEEEDISREIPLSSVERIEQIAESPTEIKLGDATFKIGDRVTSENPYTQKSVTGSIVAVGTKFTEADHPHYCGSVQVKDGATGEIEEISLSLVTPVPDESTPKFKVGNRVKIPDAGKPGAILKSLKKAAGKTGVILKIGEYADSLSALIQLDHLEDGGDKDVVWWESLDHQIWWELKELELWEPEPEQINNLDSQTNNDFAPLEQFGEYVSYRNVPGQTGAIAYLASNNKERLESWLRWLIVRHNFADCGEVVTPKTDKESRTSKGKHHLKLWHLSTEALAWICQNYDHKSNHPQQDVEDRKRPDPAAPKPYVPKWRVRINGKQTFEGTEEKARELYLEVMAWVKYSIEIEEDGKPQYYSVALQDDDYKLINGWDKSQPVPPEISLHPPSQLRQTEKFRQNFDAGLALLQDTEELENYADLEALHNWGGLATLPPEQLQSPKQELEAIPF